MSRPRLKAFLASFLVYLLPLVGPHGALPWGVLIGAELIEGLGPRDPLWIAADVVLAAALQLAAAAMFYWYFLRPRWTKLMAFVPAVGGLWGLLMWGYLLAIPRYFLVAATAAPEIDDWIEECRVANAYLPDVDTPADLSLERAGRAFIARLPDSELAVLQMPGCQVSQLGIRWSNYSPRIHSVAATGAMLYSLHDRESDQWSWWVLDGPGSEPQALERPPHADSAEPLLATDGKWVAWVLREPGEARQTLPAVRIESVQAGEPVTIDLSPFAPASFRLDHLDVAAHEIVLTRNEEEFLGLGWDGAVRWGPWNPEGIKAWAGTRRRLGGGWVVWDAYRDEEPYRLKWSLPAGQGIHTAPRGYSISSAAVDPDGRFIAVSIEGRYTFAMPDAVYVLDTADSSEVFRRSLPQYSRSRVSFLGSEFFAYAERDAVRVVASRGLPITASRNHVARPGGGRGPAQANGVHATMSSSSDRRLSFSSCPSAPVRCATA